MISPRATDPIKPGAARQPIPGVVPVLLNEKGHEITGAGEGFLAIKYPWPSMARTIAGDHQRYCETYLLMVTTLRVMVPNVMKKVIIGLLGVWMMSLMFPDIVWALLKSKVP